MLTTSTVSPFKFNQHPGSPFLLPVKKIRIKGRSTKIASILIFLLHFLPFLTNYNYPKNSIGSSSLRKSPHLLQSLVGPPNATSSPFLLAKSNSFLKLPSSVVLHLIDTRTLWSFTFLLPPLGIVGNLCNCHDTARRLRLRLQSSPRIIYDLDQLDGGPLRVDTLAVVRIS